jgi:CBS domain-containing protein
MKNEPISRIMTAAPATVSPTSSVAAAERVMREHGCHHVPVVEEDGRLVGMVSGHDLIKALVLGTDAEPELLSQASLQTRRVADVMQRTLVVLPQTATMLDAARALAGGSIHSLPVVAPNNVLAGIVTSTDLIEALLDALKSPVAEPAAAAAPDEPNTTDVQARALRDVYRAVRSYLESGRGELEHSRLLQAVNRAREALQHADVFI